MHRVSACLLRFVFGLVGCSRGNPGRLPVILIRVTVTVGLVALASLFVFDRLTTAQEKQVDGALLLIMDASGSMNETDDAGVPLIDSAKVALNGVVDALPEETPVGLRVYGHRVPNTNKAEGCKDTELIQPVAPLDRQETKGAINSFEAKGFTPIGRSLREAAGDLPSEGPRTIVLVSDGEDTCSPPPPCEVARNLVSEGIDVKIETVGFFLRGNRQAREELECIAGETGGTYRSADSAAELVDELEEVSTRAAREFVAEGEPVTGAPVPMDAETIEPGVRYVDTVVGEETNYYRFEVREGQTIEVEAIREAKPEAVEAVGGRHSGVVVIMSVVDQDDEIIGPSDDSREGLGKASIMALRDLEVPERADEVFLKFVSLSVGSEEAQNIEYTIEFVVNASGGEEIKSDQAQTGRQDAEESPGETEQTSDQNGLSTGMILLIGVLVMLVIGLGGTLAVILLRRGGV